MAEDSHHLLLNQTTGITDPSLLIDETLVDHDENNSLAPVVAASLHNEDNNLASGISFDTSVAVVSSLNDAVLAASRAAAVASDSIVQNTAGEVESAAVSILENPEMDFVTEVRTSLEEATNKVDFVFDGVNTEGSNVDTTLPQALDTAVITKSRRVSTVVLYDKNSPPPPSFLFDIGVNMRKDNAWIKNYCKLIAPTDDVSDHKGAKCVGAWCLLCEIYISYHPLKNSKSVKKHFNREHENLKPAVVSNQDDEEDDDDQGKGNELNKKNDNKRDRSIESNQLNTKRLRTSSSKVSVYRRQLQFDHLCVLWLAKSLRPSSIVSDPGLKDIIQFSSTDASLELPTEETMTAMLNRLVIHIKLHIQSEISHFSSTKSSPFCLLVNLTDVQSTIGLAATHANYNLTVAMHYVRSNTFEPQTFVLLSKRLALSGTDNEIMHKIVNEIKSVLSEYNLLSIDGSGQLKSDTIVVHNNHPKLQNICNNLGVQSFPCVGELISNCVFPFLTTLHHSDIATVLSDHLLSENETFAKIAVDEHDITFINTVQSSINKFYFLYREIQRSKDFEDVHPGLHAVIDGLDNTGKIENGTNLCFSIMNFLVEHKSVINSWQKPATCTIDIADGTATQASAYPSEEDWAIMIGLCHLLKPFDVAASALATNVTNGDDFSLPFILPFLRSIKNFLGDDQMWKVTPDYCAKSEPRKFKRILFEQFNTTHDFTSILMTLEKCRELAEKLFSFYFQSLLETTFWSSVLTHKNASWNYWKNDTEKDTAFQTLEQSAIDLAMESPVGDAVESTVKKEEYGEIMNPMITDDDYGLMFGGETNNSIVSLQNGSGANDAMAQQREEIANEMQLFRTIVSALKSSVDSRGSKVTVLEWWNQHHNRFPHVAAVARKWFSVPGLFPSSVSDVIKSSMDMRFATIPEGEEILQRLFLRGNWNVIEAAKLTMWGKEAEIVFTDLAIGNEITAKREQIKSVEL